VSRPGSENDQPHPGHPNPEEWGVEVWRGGVNTWECDEMGHMNVRFYVAKVMEGLVGLAAELGLPHAFSVGANATLLVREQHIRFLREARAAAVLHMRGGVLEMSESGARLLLVLFHSVSGEPAAAFQVVVSHVTPGDGLPFPWPSRARTRAAALAAPLPVYAAARSIGQADFVSQASLARAEALGLTPIGAGAVLAQDCDIFGRMRAEQFVSRVSDGVGRLTGLTRKRVMEASDPRPARVGGVVLEYRLVHLRWPRVGDRLLLRSGLAGVDRRTQRLIHWLLDPLSGEPWGVAEAVAAVLDLDARKLTPIQPAAEAALNAMAVKGLTL
jgi:acyl-CoA thioester hydrolase